MKGGAGYQVWLGADRKGAAFDKRPPVGERYTPDAAIGLAVQSAKAESLYHCITRDGAEWATVTPSGEIKWLQNITPTTKKGRW